RLRALRSARRGFGAYRAAGAEPGQPALHDRGPGAHRGDRLPRGHVRARPGRGRRLPVRRRGGFTLVEVAVTILIVGMTMLWLLQGLNSAKMTSAQTRNMKLARDLALMTLGQVASGQFRDDIENGLSGSYAEE